MKTKGPATALLSMVLFTCQAQSQSESDSAFLHDAQGPSNRLIKESSPYLLLHAHNPVDWYPWGDEAIEKARSEDKPIFLSVGYSTCFWCHVMEREVFSNPEIAKLMNQWFVNIKVDREERPDLDEIYMIATQLIRQSGGWPNSVFLTPELKPFFAGTYFPPEDRSGRMGFPTVLTRIHEAWTSKRDDINKSAEQLSEAMRTIVAEKRQPAETVPSVDGAERAVKVLKQRFDEANGGFGGAPKFPSPANLYLLWDRAEAGDAEARRMVVETLHKMGRGAIYDQIDGGFHRYTLDAQWRTPHFEKMLYDNAHLAELLAVTAKATEDPELDRLARGTLDFILSEMRLEGGGFKSAIDAETDGEEGAYYIWTRPELREALGDQGHELLAPIFGFNGAPNFEGEKYTLYLTDNLDAHAKRLGWSRAELLQRMKPHLDRLREVRREREFPLVDDKVLADWNGMMIAAMARGGLLLDEPRYLEAARSAATFLLGNLAEEDGTLLHAWREGTARISAFLDDYAFVMKGSVALYEATGEKRWLEAAERLADEMEGRLRDPNGGYYLSEERPHLLFQPKTIFDGAIPSGNGVATLALLSLSEHTGKAVYRQRAAAAMKAFAEELNERPAALRTLALAVDRYHRGSGASSTLAGLQSPSEKQKPESIAKLAEKLVKPEIVMGEESKDNSAWRPFELRLTIREGWHVNANPPSLKYLIPTEVQGEVRNVRYPEGEIFKFSFSEDALSVYSGTVSIHGEVEPGESELRLVYQACDDRRCLAPVEKTVELPGEN
jgi:uncharacterized protein YyaL (SSP411 family)